VCVRFNQNAYQNLLDKKEITIKVFRKDGVLYTTKADASDYPLSPSFHLDRAHGPPSITMVIQESSGSLQFQLYLGIPRIMESWIPLDDPIKFPIGKNQDPESVFSAFFTQIEHMSCNRRAFEIVSREGRSIFKDFFSRKLKANYFKYEKYISSIKVFSNEPYIPWELARPYADGRTDNFFLCERYSFSRGFEPNPNLYHLT